MSTSQNPIISFDTDGRYDIRLNASNEYGSTIYTRTGYIRVGDSGYGLNWDPELGIWTKDWWDSSASIPDPASLWGGITAPLTALIGSLLYVWIWLVLVAGAWLYTGETTTPYVIGLLSGSALAGTAQLVGQDGGIMMMIVMGFAGAGVLAKVIAGRG
jgi:PKD repeat protein